MAAQGRRGGAAVEAGFARDGGVRGGVAAGGASAVRGAFKVLHCCAAAGAAGRGSPRDGFGFRIWMFIY
jgi:hypothetical protein